MKGSCTSLPERMVKLTRDTAETGADGKPVETSISLVVRPYPAGFPQWLVSVYPAPVSYVNGEPVPDKVGAPTYAIRLNVLLLAKCLGDQLDTVAPAGVATREAWDSYAVAILGELGAANLVQGDIDALSDAMILVNRGAGRLGKVNS